MKRFFLTSDNPVFVTNPSYQGFGPPGLGLDNTRVFVPSSKKIGFLIIRSTKEELDNQSVIDNSEIVINMNKGIVLNSSEFIFAHEKSNQIIRLIENVNNNR